MTTIALSEPILTFAEAVSATGADATWLRTLLQRDKGGRIGAKHRTGRLLFSLADVIRITVLSSLNARLRVAPQAAWDVVDALEAMLKSEDFDWATADIHLGFDPAGHPLVWTVGADGLLVTWNDTGDDHPEAAIHASLDAHIIVPIGLIAGPLEKAHRLIGSQ